MEREEQSNQFEVVKARLEEIANQVDDENLSLDEALDLYEEAVKLGLQASDLLEVGIEVEEEPEEGAVAKGATPENAEAASDGVASAGSDTPAASSASSVPQD